MKENFYNANPQIQANPSLGFDGGWALSRTCQPCGDSGGDEEFGDGVVSLASQSLKVDGAGRWCDGDRVGLRGLEQIVIVIV